MLVLLQFSIMHGARRVDFHELTLHRVCYAVAPRMAYCLHPHSLVDPTNYCFHKYTDLSGAALNTPFVLTIITA